MPDGTAGRGFQDFVRALGDALRLRIVKEADVLLQGPGPFEPYDIFVNLAEPHENYMIYDGQGGVGLFIQTISCPVSCKLRLNRLDGPTYDPSQESIYVGTVRRLFLTNAAGTGQMHIRIHTDPTVLFTVMPQLAISDFFYRDTSGARKDLALESTLQAVLAQLQSLNINTDQLETYTDGLEGLITSTNTKLDTLIANTDTLESLLGNRSSFTANQVTVGTTAVQLHTNLAIPEGKAVVIKSLAGNTGKVYIGPSGVTTSTGYEISAGDEAPPLMVTNLNLVYAIADAAGQKVCYIIEQ